MYDNTPKYIGRDLAARDINILQVRSFLDFLSFIGNSDNSDVESQEMF